MIVYYTNLQTELGEILTAATAKGICLLSFLDDESSKASAFASLLKTMPTAEFREKQEGFQDLKQELQEYFARKRKTFDLPLDIQGTDFQKKAWQELLAIPYGTTISYGEQAQRIGQAKACRAVGHANSLNKIGIVIPCHRVLAAGGGIGGYAGGLWRKKRLLAIEQGEI